MESMIDSFKKKRNILFEIYNFHYIENSYYVASKTVAASWLLISLAIEMVHNKQVSDS